MFVLYLYENQGHVLFLKVYVLATNVFTWKKTPRRPVEHLEKWGTQACQVRAQHQVSHRNLGVGWGPLSGRAEAATSARSNREGPVRSHGLNHPHGTARYWKSGTAERNIPSGQEGASRTPRIPGLQRGSLPRSLTRLSPESLNSARLSARFPGDGPSGSATR